MSTPLRLPLFAAPRCFRTAADGRIPLTTDWSALLAAAQKLPAVALQTRHASARLVALDVLPTLEWDRNGAWTSNERGTLRLHCAHWAQAWGRLERCDCCGSPGRVEILNAAGAEFLQLCGAPDCSLATWSEFLDALAPHDSTIEPLRASGGPWLPLLPGNTRPLDAAPEALAPLLAVLGDDAVPIRCTLATGEAQHTCLLRPRHVAISDGLLTAHETAVTCQLALPAVTGLAAELTSSGWSLHAVGVGGTQLLSFSPAPVRGAVRAWAAALEAAFPELS